MGMPPVSTAVFAPVGVKRAGSPDACACRRATSVPCGTSSMPTFPLRYADSRYLFLWGVGKGGGPGQLARDGKGAGSHIPPEVGDHDLVELLRLDELDCKARSHQHYCPALNRARKAGGRDD